jgi:hypothetical protein
VQRGEDPKKDAMRTKRVITVLKSYPGQDRFRLRLVDSTNTVTVEFPNITTCYEGPVEDFLLKTFGAEAIQVQPLPES